MKITCMLCALTLITSLCWNDGKAHASAPDYWTQAQVTDLGLDGPFNLTLWHEFGHYLGVDKTKDGRELNEPLARQIKSAQRYRYRMVEYTILRNRSAR